MKNLVIVESPAKAKTIEKYLGRDFSVKSSFGHIRDLPKKGMGIDIQNNFTPDYQISPDKKKTIGELKKAVKTAETIWLASDEDREGEAIAWHLCAALGLDTKNTKRIVFHEITKSAIEQAVKNPRTVNQPLVDAQQARRILDRLVGYELSPVLWKKLRPGLSAGRVQSVAVRLIVEREREIKAFEPVLSYKINALFLEKGQDLLAELPKGLTDAPAARKFLEDCTDATFSVETVTEKPGVRSSSPPFTTSTLQQDAARRLGYSVKQTMTLAQRLYENGHITYMRTDSVALSSLALNAAKKYIVDSYGNNYHQARQYVTKNKSAQEAHEAIRPTNFNKLQAGSEGGEQRLYQLIWQRALASQMAPASIKRTEITIAISSRPELLLAKGEVLNFDGFYKVYGQRRDDSLLPPLTKGQALSLEQMVATESYSRPPARYSEASLVRTLESLGIGRPSTYAPTISTIQDRGYVERGDSTGNPRLVKKVTLEKGSITESEDSEQVGADTGKLIPTDVAEVTTDFLVKHFADIVNYDFTARSEEKLDDVADGKQSWQAMIGEFYKTFHPLVISGDKVSRQEAVQARELGIDPESKRPLYARFGRYGSMLQIGDKEDEHKPRFATLPSGTTIDSVTFDQALSMFELPRTVGTTEAGEAITANIGRFGPYIQVDPLPDATNKDKVYVSLKEEDPLTIDESTARILITQKREAIAKKVITDFGNKIQVLNGPYGPYVTDGTKNARISKEVDPSKLNLADCQELLAKTPIKKRGFRSRRTKKR